MNLISSVSKEKALGMLLGAHCGEALGASFEFGPANSPDHFETEIIGGGPFDWLPGSATDDMDMMMCLMRTFSSSNGFDHQALAKHFVDWYEGEPEDIGGTVSPALAKMSEGKNPLECGSPNPEAQGNGSLMRCAPIALYFEGSELEKAAREQCVFTHGSPTCQDVDVIFLEALQNCFEGKSKEDIYHAAVDRASELNSDVSSYLKKVTEIEWDELSTSGWTIHTLGAAFWALLQTETFEEGVIQIANKGDDSDTCGCVAGALMGAFYGLSSIPDRWISTLEYRSEIEKLLS